MDICAFIQISSFIIGCLLVFGYIIMNCIYGIYLNYSYNSEINAIINTIEESINGKLIFSFRNRTECKSNEEELIIDRFESIPEFCNCDGTFMGNGKCEEDQDNCKTINSIPSNYFTIINSQHICVMKSEKSYIELLKNNDIISKDKECPENYKSCGIIDTLERKLCIKNKNDCPITKADIENNNNNSSQILSLFKIRPNYPCINPIEKNWVYYDDLSPLTKLCTKNDDRYEKIDKFNTNFYDLYKDNNILEVLPSYDENELKKEKIYFYARNFLGINEEKAFQFSKEKIISSNELITNCKVAMKIVTFILIVTILISVIGYLVSFCKYLQFFVPLLFFIIPAIIIYFILSIIILVNHIRITSMLNIGSDEYMNLSIKDLLDGNSINFIIPLLDIIIFFFILIFFIILGILLKAINSLYDDD